MKISQSFRTLLAILFFISLVGCTARSDKSPDVSKDVRKSLDQAGLQAVKVKQDRDLGVVTLTGEVNSEDQKTQAGSIAQSIAGQQTVANQVTVTPSGQESEAKSVTSDLDSGIEKNLDAALLQHGMQKSVKYDVSNSVVTLTGHLNSEARRAEAARIAARVPNVKQVVNEIQVKGQKATSMNR